MNIVLVGAGGTGMSGVAGIMHDLGYTNIIAIDAVESELTRRLEAKGLQVLRHGNYQVQWGDIVIYSEAVAESEEVLEARRIMKAKKEPMIILNYFEFLGEVSKYFISVGFAGTNGKSSTTALAITTAKKVLPNLGLGILGALVPELDNNSYYINPKYQKDIRMIFDYMFSRRRQIISNQILLNPQIESSGILSSNLLKSLYFFVEACEYKRHFLHLDLDYAAITSLELDHTDYYKDMKDYTLAFKQFSSKVKNQIFIPKGLQTSSFKLQAKEVSIKKLPFKHIRGAHNNINGSLVIALLNNLLASTSKDQLKSSVNLLTSLTNFKGLRRRMEYLGTNTNGAKIFSDYGHMASSIALGYQALKERFPKQKIRVIFQPHQINRVILGRNDFIKSMKGYDEVTIYDIYAAREDLQELIKKKKELKHIKTLKELGDNFAEACGGIYIDDPKKIIEKINEAKKGEIVVIYSAGYIDFLVRRFLGK